MKLFDWIRRDGLLHIETSALLVIAFQFILPLWLSAVISFIFGVLKELWDRRHNGVPSWHDIICDLGGIAAGTVLVLVGNLAANLF